MTTAVRARPRYRSRRTAAWTIAKLLLFAAAVGLASAAYLSWRPVVNPGVQDCGSPLAYFMTNRENVLLHPGEPGAPPNAVALASQPTCRDLATVEIQKAGIGVGAFFLLGLLGIIVGLIDDRVDYWKAPTFETLLKPMPRDVRIEHGLEPKVAVDDLGSTLPPLESPELLGIGLIGLLTFVVLPFAGPLDITRAAWHQATVGPVLVGLLLTIVLFAAAAVQRKGVFPASAGWRRVVEVVLAAAFSGRLRPVVGSFGIDLHHLRRTGSSRDDAVQDVQVLESVAGLSHLVLLGVATLLVLPTFRHRPPLDYPQWVLVGGIVIVLLSGLQRLPRRIRALPIRPGRPGLRGIPRVAGSPDRIAFLVGGTIAQSLVGALVLATALACFGGHASFAVLLFVVLASVTVGSLSTTPNAIGVFEGVMALLLMQAGIDIGIAICAALLYRVLTLWMPMLVGWRAARSLESVDAL